MSRYGAVLLQVQIVRIPQVKLSSPWGCAARAHRATLPGARLLAAAVYLP